jgi:hypothetical protein
MKETIFYFFNNSEQYLSKLCYKFSVYFWVLQSVMNIKAD